MHYIFTPYKSTCESGSGSKYTTPVRILHLCLSLQCITIGEQYCTSDSDNHLYSWYCASPLGGFAHTILPLSTPYPLLVCAISFHHTLGTWQAFSPSTPSVREFRKQRSRFVHALPLPRASRELARVTAINTAKLPIHTGYSNH